MRFLSSMLLALLCFSPLSINAQEESRTYNDRALHQAVRRYVKPDFQADLLIQSLRSGFAPLITKRLYEAGVATLDHFIALVNVRSNRAGLLSPEQAAALLKFYLIHDFSKNKVWRRHLNLKTHANRIFKFVKAIEWPPVPSQQRTVSETLPPIYKEQWRAAARPFFDRKLRRVFLFIQAARINHEEGHPSLYNLSDLHEIFLDDLQRTALGKEDPNRGDPLLALRALRVYVVSSKTDAAIARNGIDPARWPETQDEASKLAKFILELNAMSYLEALAFFATGEVPKRVLLPESKIIRRVVDYFKSHSQKFEASKVVPAESAVDLDALAVLRRACAQ